MSKCYSSHGEYSSHESKDGFTCEWCGVFDEQAALNRIAELESEREAGKGEWPPHWTIDDRLRDLHARYHGQSGNMLGRDECEWYRCEFWDPAKFALSEGPAADEQEAGR